ncbi:MAG: hypothetical protein ACD_3C00142G0012 [uncultured bacterium (gcode 4)]|uniref:YgjP-like metallopeptidase domain-containing protein n=1 Tax=uncultured bacterium (gcode 4) TaxID=1234023 RepID=K2F9P9_9BACT|nr:MAG: hypothetical protein ACD_3C00142G0012 [uncultured bacterium (gcode 4)]
MEYTIQRKKVKNLRITVKSSWDIIVSAPWFYTKWQIDKIVKSKEEWIENRLEKLKNNKLNLNLDSWKIMYLWDNYEFVFDEKKKIDLIDLENKKITSRIDLSNDANLAKWHKTNAKKYLVEKTQELVIIHSFKAGKISVRTQKTRWGSCSAKNNISINSNLIKCPPRVIEYVIYHELAHTIQKNHSKKFWDLLWTYQDDYQEQRKWLKTHGNMFIVP